MYGYIYKTTNLINGMIYIGQHKAINFSKKYKGSGKLIIEAFHKYGKENFTVELLEWCETKEELDEKERYWVSYFGLPNFEIGYNILKGGQDKSFEGCTHSEETKLIMSQKKLGIKLSPKTCSKISKNKTGAKYPKTHSENVSKGLKEKYAKDKENGIQIIRKPKGYKNSDETKEKMRQAHIGKTASQETRQKMSQSHIGSKHKPHKPHNYPKGVKRVRNKNKIDLNNASNSGELQK